MALVALWRGASCNEQLLLGRPQRHWIQMTDNFECDFVPKLPVKPHARYPLQSAILAAQRRRYRDIEKGLRHKGQRSPGTSLFVSHDAFLQHEGRHTLPHPYEGEIRDIPLKPLSKP